MRLGMALLGLVAGALLVGQSPGIAATVTPPQRQVLAARPKAAADPQNDPFLRGINALESARWDWAMAAEKQLDDKKKSVTCAGGGWWLRGIRPIFLRSAALSTNIPIGRNRANWSSKPNRR